MIGPILITGGTGTVGAALLRHWADRDDVTVLSRGEHRQERLARKFPSVKFVIGDVRDEGRLRQVMRGHRIVIHAAALKIAPAGEPNPYEFVLTNATGTEFVCRAARDVGVRRLMTISTDKAVEPVGVYGASKLAAERLTLAANNAAELLASVFRMGNVVNSRGSVVPLFRALAAAGNPLPITDRRMTRFFIRPEDAANAIVTCLLAQQGGEIFAPRCAAARITDIADMLGPGAEQKEIGLRPGERAHETLVGEDEYATAADVGELMILRPGPIRRARSRYSSDKEYQTIGPDLARLIAA